MTTRGTFIVNGVERVVVSQLVRSAGVYFTAMPYRGRQLFGAKIIPSRGAWLEFETDVDGQIGVKIDRRRKVAVTDILRIFGMDNEKIKSGVREGGQRLHKLPGCDVQEGCREGCRRIICGDLPPPAAGRPGERGDRKKPH